MIKYICNTCHLVVEKPFKYNAIYLSAVYLLEVRAKPPDDSPTPGDIDTEHFCTRCIAKTLITMGENLIDLEKIVSNEKITTNKTEAKV